MREFTVTFKEQRRSVIVPQGTDVLMAAAKAGITLRALCGGEGICGKCRVIVNKGDMKATASYHVSEADRKRRVILACQTLVESDMEVTIPKESLEVYARSGHESEDFTKGDIILKRERLFKFSPLVKKIYIELHEPTIDDNTSDLDRIVNALRDRVGESLISTRLANVKHLSECLRESGFKVTAVLAYKATTVDILSLEAGDTTGSSFALAFDIGTTTVAGQLIDLNTNSIIGTRIAFNKQALYGADIITRIIYASKPDGMEELNTAILDNINEMINDFRVLHKVALSNIYAVMVAGNMTMMHLLLKIDPSGIRKAPYISTISSLPMLGSSEIAIGINPKGVAAFLPGVSTYIGGDVVSGILACGLTSGEELTMLVDIGTNGEIVLGNREWMIASAASAGPAFEGSGLACGMKASSGAIQRVAIDANLDVGVETIGSEAPKGICGSGYIDLLCQMLRRGVIGKDGRIDRGIESRRVRKVENNYEFVIAFAAETAIGRDIVIQDDDIDNLKRSKAAIYSAIITLINKVGKDTSEIKRIYIAGGFGSYLNIENSIFIGLLPDIERSVYEFIGNSSLAGARMSLVSREAFDRAAEIAKNITYLDLSSEPSYMDEYIASLFFPHTDIGRFPSVRS